MPNLSFANNSINVYMYESFSYTISNTPPSSFALTTTKTSGIPASYLTTDLSRSVTFASSSNAMVPGTQQFTVSKVDKSGNILSTSTNTVNVGAGRFLDNSFNSFVGSNYIFYAKEAITPIKLRAPFNLASPVTSTPALPPGLSFSAIDVSSVTIQGIPTTTVPQSNYLIIGRESGTSKTVSSTLPIVISNERIQTNITNSGIVSGMQIDNPITPLTLTSIGNGTFRYTWTTLPVGIRATDNSGSTVTSPFSPSDLSKTLVIVGTPTTTTASNFINAGYGGTTGLTQQIQVDRIFPSPLLSKTVPITFQFAPTVLFDTPPTANLFTNLAVDPSQTYYRAASYFTSGTTITNIFSPNLRSDLSLAFNGVDRAYLIGNPKPNSVGNANYTIRAINSSLATRDVSAQVIVVNDSVTFNSPTPAVDTCYNFVFSRSLDLSLNGYYPSPITFSAYAASGNAITWSSTGLTGTGLSLSSITGSTTSITGTPTITASLTTLTVKATAANSDASSSRAVKFSILDDAITSFLTPYVNDRLLTQNMPMNPIQFTATMLSGNPIQKWSATNLLGGLKLSQTGLLTGTPITARDTQAPAFTLNTRYTSKPYTPSWGFYSGPDVALVTIPTTNVTVPTTFSNVEFRVLPYSQTTDVSMTVSTSRGPYQGSNFTVSMSGNYLQGDFSQIALLPKYRLGINGYAGVASNTWPMDITVNNAPTFVKHIIGVDVSSGASSTIKLVRNTQPSVGLIPSFGYTYVANVLTWSNANVPSGVLSNVPYGIHDMAQNGNVLVAVVGSNMIRSTDAGSSWYQIPSSNIQAVDLSGIVSPSYYTTRPLFGCIATDGSSNWITLANGWDGSTLYNIVRTSSDNGATWTDTRVTNFVDIDSNTKLYYNNMRYFVISGTSALQPLLYAASFNPTVWTAAGLTHYDSINALAFNGNTVLAVGSNGASSACYSSTNNGTTWTSLPSSPISPYTGSAQINTAGYAYGKWVVGGTRSTGYMQTVYSTDLVTWTGFSAGSIGTFTANVEDGSAWLFAGTGSVYPGYTALWDSSGVPTLTQGWGVGTLPAVSSKRITSTIVSNGTPTLTLSMLYNSSGFAFDTPRQDDYINWQYVPIPTITLEANGPGIGFLGGEGVVYITTQLPDGLTLTLIPFPTNQATITGTSVTYSDAPQRIQVYAVGVDSFRVLTKTLSMRTILPTVYKQQTSAGSWTSYIRQYTEVNAATTARDNKATPAIEYRLGEFISPDPPSVTTEQSNCNC